MYDIREANLRRITNETEIEAALSLDGTGVFRANMPIGFFQHMLEQVVRHGLFDLSLTVVGDTHVDGHHTIEDTGIVLGQALSRALGEKVGITRYGHALVPMDDTLARCVVDLSGRPYLHFEAPFTTPCLGDMDTEMVKEFFQALCVHGGLNIHAQVLHGENNHHMAEALFKALGRALCQAVTLCPRTTGVPSTKGNL